MPFNRSTIFGIGIPIKVALIKCQMFQGDVARQLGIPMSTFNMKLLGRRKWTEDERARMSEILGESEGVLFEEYESQSPGNGETASAQDSPQQGQ